MLRPQLDLGVERLVPQALLSDKIRPAPNGVQTQRAKTNVDLCTVGFNATRLKRFVTASQGILDKTGFFQPDDTKATHRVSAETVEAPAPVG